MQLISGWTLTRAVTGPRLLIINNDTGWLLPGEFGTSEWAVIDRGWTLVWVRSVALLLVFSVDDFHVTRNFTFNAFVGFALHLAMLVHPLSSLLDFTHRSSDQLDLHVIFHVLIDHLLTLSLTIASILGFLLHFDVLFAQTVVQGQLLLKQLFLSIFDH